MAQTFLPYMGSKRRVVQQLLDALPKTWGTYHEPFLGSGALLYALAPERAFASDKLPLLIELHRAVAEDVDGVIEEYRQLAQNKRQNFFDIRARHPRITPPQFLFLMKHCHGNRHRTNKEGRFNTPFKENSAGTVCDRVLQRDACKLKAAAAVSGTRDICFNTCSFEEALLRVQDGDLLFLDPPYSRCREHDYGSEFGVVGWAALMDNVRMLVERCARVWILMTLSGGMSEEEVRSVAQCVPGLINLHKLFYDGTHIQKGGLHVQFDWLITNYRIGDCS